MLQGQQSIAKTYELIQGEKQRIILDRYKYIKLKNEILKISTYTQFWKQTTSSQGRLLSTFDAEKGRMKMAFLQAHIAQPKSAADYKKTSFEFDAKDIHAIDQKEIYKKTIEIIFSTLTNSSMNVSKLNVSLTNIQSQLNIENLSSQAKDNE